MQLELALERLAAFEGSSIVQDLLAKEGALGDPR
jgi:hypothetical protein